ncbi:S-layer homology domain-containing protein [Paenibacillus cremeus]|uniref:DUF4430 domain-containing protein n=1 Tax=Paenibacillus cremeus TaxID=2163881 RepID=A0A559K670_9BACL|nr:S-layer homology domain-containing protein [Paenibacillus cremeus]TVY07610.1 DUF4430 domain-containing protein [Paenibacillus cremeus]
MRLRYLSKSFIALVMSFMLLFSTLSFTMLPASQVHAAESGQGGAVTVTEAIYQAADLLLGSGELSDWGAVGISRTPDRKVPISYLTNLDAAVRAANGTYSSITEYERITLGLTAAGANGTQFAGYNLVEKIYNNTQMTGQGLNGPLYGLLALDSGNYEVPSNALWSRDQLLDTILSGQKADGGFAISLGSTGASDPDFTGMALSALAPYTAKRADVKAAVDRAVDWLATNQNVDGGYTFLGDQAGESVAQAIIGLTANGVDPKSDRFTKQGGNLIERLMLFRTTDGGFAHSIKGSTNGIATEQALTALVAYNLFNHGDRSLYSLVPPGQVPPTIVQVNVQVEGPQSHIADGTTFATTALEAVEKVLQEKGMPYQVISSSYIGSINHIAGGKYGGWDGWYFAVQKNNLWSIPPVGMADYNLTAGERITVYYGGEKTNPIDQISFDKPRPTAGESFTATITQYVFDWLNYQQVIPSPPAPEGVSVTVGSTTVKTDTYGKASFSGLPEGTYPVTVTGYVYNDTAPPKVVRAVSELIVAPSTTTPGGGGGGVVPQTKTITLSVEGDSQKGTILDSTSVELLTGDTAYSVLARKLGSRVSSRGSGSSIYVSSIDGLNESGSQKGWMYSVNGTFPNYSAGAYTLKDKDVVAWKYTENLGSDIGAGSSGSSAAVVGIAPGSTIDQELNKLSLPLNNTESIGNVGKTTALLNPGEKMSASQAEQLQKDLKGQTVALSKATSTSADTELKDEKEEVRFVVPAAALSQTVQIGVDEQSSADRPELVSGLYEFSPSGTTFSTPAVMAIKVPVQTDSPDNLALVWLNETTGQWIPVPAVLDVKTGIITAKVTHFTKYAVVDRSKLKAEEKPQLRSAAVEISAAAQQILAGDTLSDWEAFGLARAGKTVPSSYLAQTEQLVKEQNGKFRKVTDLERIALAVKAAGAEPTNIAGFNLIQLIVNHEKMTEQGLNGPIFALLTLDNVTGGAPSNAVWTKEKLITWILEQQNASGGFPLVKGEEDNSDITAMAISALAAHQDRADVKSAVDKAVSRLSQMQASDGGYALYGESNSESVSQAIIALASANISIKDARFVKSGTDLLSKLLSYKNADGGYAHTAGQASNEIATEQALMALVAYERYIQNQSGLFQLQPTTASKPAADGFVDESEIASWALDSVHSAYASKLMTGISESELRFAPKQEMTRAQFAAIIVRLLKETPDTGSQQRFEDVQPGSWYYGFVMKAQQKGIIQGVSETKFNPDQPVTREQMATMIARALKLDVGAKVEPVADQSDISQEALPYVNAVQQHELMEGYNGSFYPAAPVTREMAAVVVMRLAAMEAQ